MDLFNCQFDDDMVFMLLLDEGMDDQMIFKTQR